MRAIYFNGKNSKPREVRIRKTIEGIFIIGINHEDDIDVLWEKRGINSQSFSSGDKILLSYGDHPQQRLEITGIGSEDYLAYSLYHENGVKHIYHWIMRANPLKIVILSILSLLMMIYSYMQIFAPFIEEKAVNIIPQHIEIQVGQEAFISMEDKLDVDSVKSIQLQAFYEACDFKSGYNIEVY